MGQRRGARRDRDAARAIRQRQLSAASAARDPPPIVAALDHAGGANATNPVRRRLVVEKPPLRIEDSAAGKIAGPRQERRVLDHRLRRARPGDLGRDRRNAVAKLVERQVVEDDVDQAPKCRRRVLAVEVIAVLDVLSDQPAAFALLVDALRYRG
jgi:hypothetical protein